MHYSNGSDPADRPAWMVDGACRGLNPRLFYLDRGDDSEPAKRVCRDCVVQAQCLAHALTEGEKFGVWGGATERERRRLLRQRAERAKLAS